MTTLSFKVTHNYGAAGDGITIPIELSHGDRRVKLLAKVDTGATFCIFNREYGEALGLEIEAGEKRTIFTATSPFETFGHEVTIESFGWQTTSTVLFATDASFSRNVLGRNGWIRLFRLGIVDYDATIHLNYYDEP